MKTTNTSPHILGTASNLLGLCFIVLTALKVKDYQEASIIDEFTSIAIILFMTSIILSFLSLRHKNEIKSEKLENFADIFFFCGIIVMFVSTVLTSLNYI